MAYNRPDILADYRPELMYELIDGKWMLENRLWWLVINKYEWLEKYHPNIADACPRELMANLDIKRLYEQNPMWLLYHRPDIMIDLDPTLMIEKRPHWVNHNRPELMPTYYPEVPAYILEYI